MAAFRAQLYVTVRCLFWKCNSDMYMVHGGVRYTSHTAVTTARALRVCTSSNSRSRADNQCVVGGAVKLAFLANAAVLRARRLVKFVQEHGSVHRTPR